jgi:hypothetical protein
LELREVHAVVQRGHRVFTVLATKHSTAAF